MHRLVTRCLTALHLGARLSPAHCPATTQFAGLSPVDGESAVGTALPACPLAVSAHLAGELSWFLMSVPWRWWPIEAFRLVLTQPARAGASSAAHKAMPAPTVAGWLSARQMMQQQPLLVTCLVSDPVSMPAGKPAQLAAEVAAVRSLLASLDASDNALAGGLSPLQPAASTAGTPDHPPEQSVAAPLGPSAADQMVQAAHGHPHVCPHPASAGLLQGGCYKGWPLHFEATTAGSCQFRDPEGPQIHISGAVSLLFALHCMVTPSPPPHFVAGNSACASHGPVLWAHPARLPRSACAPF